MNPEPALEQVAQAKRHLYSPRSRHRRRDGGPRFTNRLVREDSPYLLQHAHNPVDWYAWGDEAFAAARGLNRPVFLSIGYATCHWCHVMEEESFDDLEVAQALNDHFISIKVDREQRPDLDDHFMTAVQLIGGQGGWPMTSLLTPDGKPFFGATYLPKGALLQLLERVRALWTAQPDGLLETGERLQQAILAQNPQPGATDRVGEDVLQRCLQQILDAEDRQHGGSMGAPKFPQEPQLLLLLDAVQRTGDRALQHPAWGYLQRTLDAMLRGGIYDQVGGGFHRYATDAAWRVPHFEKMLYNQAQLALVYLRAWVIGGEPEHRRIVRETLDYLLAEMRAPAGGFHSATDADSEGGEGRAFTWTLDELSSLLTPDELAFVRTLYGVSAGGNFEGRNVLHLPQPLTARVPELAESYAALRRRLDGIRARLLEARRKRPPPLRDEKEITEWNAMTILALAEAGRLLAEPRYLEAAQRCALAIWRRVETPGQLYRNCIRDRPSIAATLADYACYLQALMALYDCTGDSAWRERARCVQGEMEHRFADSRGGGFFNADRDVGGPDLGRSKVAMDLTTPSGNSAALMALVALQARTGTRQLDATIRRLEACFADAVERQPLAFSAMLAALERRRHPLPATLQYAAAGRIRVEVRRLLPEVVGVRLQIADGWHLGGHLPGEAGVAATELVSVDPARPLDRVEYPRSQPLAEGRTGWLGDVSIHAHLRQGAGTGPRLLSLRLQACGESRCLAPETLQLLVPARPVSG